jgi:hypothetical protein
MCLSFLWELRHKTELESTSGGALSRLSYGKYMSIPGLIML